MTILYINEEHCTSMEQLRGYFKETLSYDSPLFYDLLDYAYSGDISSWLREKGEVVLANQIDGIDRDFGDSEYFSRLSALITGNENIPDSLEKPAFSKCFQVEEVRQEETSEGKEVQVLLKVLSSVNETYEFCVRTSWGQKGDKVNPFREKKDGILTVPFKFRKRPNVDFKVVELLADGIALADVPCVGLGGEVQEFEVGSCCFKMIRVEHGTFMMGATREQKNPNDYEKPAHQVTLTNDYYIGETQVTQALWQAVMGNNPSSFHGDNLPVVSVSWDDCQKFIQRLNKKTGKTFRLPTEAEWEYAARGGKKSHHTQYSGSNKIKDVAWYDGNSGSKTHPVKTKHANELGIYDMSGNVWEWCQDWFGNYGSDAQTNPTGPKSGASRVRRGGCCSYDACFCRLSCRDLNSPVYRYYYLGLRLVLSK